MEEYFKDGAIKANTHHTIMHDRGKKNENENENNKEENKTNQLILHALKKEEVITDFEIELTDSSIETAASAKLQM